MQKDKIYRIYTISSEEDVDNIKYVGCTTKELNERLSGHKYTIRLKKSYHPFYSWLNDQYSNNIKVVIKLIEECDIHSWKEREQYWIAYYRNIGCDICNKSKGGDGVVLKEDRPKKSIERSVEAKELPVIALTLNGSFYKKFDSIKKATEYFKLNSKSAIGNVLAGRSKSAANHLWVLEKDYDPNKKYSYNPCEPDKIKVYQFDLDGNLIKEWESMRDTKISFSTLKKAIDNKLLYKETYLATTSKINISQYENPYKYCIKYSNGNIKKYKQLKEIAKEYNIAASTATRKKKEHLPLEDGGMIYDY